MIRLTVMNVQILALVDSPQNHTMGHGSRNYVRIFLSIAEVHGVVIGRLEKDILASVRIAFFIPNVCQQLAAPTAGVDEDVGFREHGVKLLKRRYFMSHKLATEFGNLLPYPRQMNRGVHDETVIRPSGVEIRGILPWLQDAKLSSVG